MKRTVIVLFSMVLLLSSCEQFRTSFHHHDRRIARVGMDVLYESDIAGLIPQGISSEDSAAMVDQYARSWALGKLLLRKAEDELPKSEKDISDQLEEYKKSLLGFRYEKYYIEERLDTTVLEPEMRAYYEEHQNSFVSQYSIVKGRVVTILTKSPYYDVFKKSYTATEQSDVNDLVELSYSSAEKYNDFDGGWISVTTLAKELRMDVDACEAMVALHKTVEKENGVYTQFVFIEDKVAPGEVSPFEFNRDRIRETIISKRKQDLLATLERDLLNDAKSNKTYKVYDNE